MVCIKKEKFEKGYIWGEKPRSPALLRTPAPRSGYPSSPPLSAPPGKQLIDSGEQTESLPGGWGGGLLGHVFISKAECEKRFINPFSFGINMSNSFVCSFCHL